MSQKILERSPNISIGLRSGLSGGVLHQAMLLLSKKLCVYRLQCFGSLSCWKRWDFRNTFLMNGIKLASTIVQHRIAVITPVRITICVAPLYDIPPHMWTFTGCLARGLSFLGSFLLRKHRFPWLSSWTEHSSEKITSLNCSFVSSILSHHCTLLLLLASRISWQYFGRMVIQPRSLWARLVVLTETSSSGHCFSRIPRSCLAVSSLLAASASLMATSCSSPSFFVIRCLGMSPTLPVSQYRFNSLYNDTWLIKICSSSNRFCIFVIVEPLYLSITTFLLISMLIRGIFNQLQHWLFVCTCLLTRT